MKCVAGSGGGVTIEWTVSYYLESQFTKGRKWREQVHFTGPTQYQWSVVCVGRRSIKCVQFCNLHRILSKITKITPMSSLYKSPDIHILYSV